MKLKEQLRRDIQGLLTMAHGQPCRDKLEQILNHIISPIGDELVPSHLAKHLVELVETNYH
jgi:hypothetical protein